MKHFIEYDVGDHFLKRAIGLIGTQQKSEQKTLFLPNCKSIHTFFMKEVLDLVWVDKYFKVLEIMPGIIPRQIKYNKLAFGVFEFLPNQLMSDIRVGDFLLRRSSSFSLRRFYLDNSGQALVEMALCLPFFLMLVVGLFQLSLGLMAQQKLLYGVQHITQVGSLTNNNLKISGALEGLYPQNSPSLVIKNLDLEGHAILRPRQYQDILSVELASPFVLNIPFFESPVLTLSATASAPVLCFNNQPPYACE